MRNISKEPGMIVSALAHVSALVLMLVALPSAKPFEEVSESTAVEVLSAAQFAALTQGAARETKPTENPRPKSEKAEIPKQGKAEGKPDLTDKPSLLPPPPRVAEIPDQDSPPPLPPKRPEKAPPKAKPAKKAEADPPALKNAEAAKPAAKKAEPNPVEPDQREAPPPLRTASLPEKKAELEPVEPAKVEKPPAAKTDAREIEKDADEVIRQLQAEEAARVKQAAAKVAEQKRAEDAARKKQQAAAKEKRLAAEKTAAAKEEQRKLAEAEAAEAAEAEQRAAEKATAEKAAAEAEKIAEAKAAKAEAAAKAKAIAAAKAEAQANAEAEAKAQAEAKAEAEAEKKAIAKAAAEEKARKDKLAALIKSRQSSDRTEDDGTDQNQISAKKASATARVSQDNPEDQSQGGSKAKGSSLSPAQKEGLANAIIDQLRGCTGNLSGDEIAEMPRIRLSINADGSLQGAPQLLRASDPAATTLARAVMRGARGCAPFTIPAQYQSAMAEAGGADLSLTLNPSELQ